MDGNRLHGVDSFAYWLAYWIGLDPLSDGKALGASMQKVHKTGGGAVDCGETVVQGLIESAQETLPVAGRGNLRTIVRRAGLG